ncbi:urocanate hydratase, partial [Staphylococcus aureus]
RYCDVKTRDLDEALTLAEDARKQGKPLSIGLVGNAVDVHQAILDKGFKIDIITDQTSAHDPLNGYVPQ